jgi:hypothetical protein
MSVSVIGGNIEKMGIATVTVDLGSVATITTEEETFSCPGVQVGDFVAVSKPSLEAGIALCDARVSAKDTIAVKVVNPTAGAVDAASEAGFLVFWARPSRTTGKAEG